VRGADVSLPRWMGHAACIPHIAGGDDPWHPDDELPRRNQAAEYEWARAVCVTCPVIVLCGRLGLELLNTDGLDGMYGGMTPDELRDVARKVDRSPRRVAQHGTRSRYVNYKCHCPPCTAANSQGEADRRARKAFSNSRKL
jgi:hypothetical protein